MAPRAHRDLGMSATPRITGATRLFAIIGDPIAQVRSPEVFTARFAANGIDSVLVPVHIASADLEVVIPALMKLRNLDGLLITVPFKARMVRYAARLGVAAECIGAVNALRREVDDSWTGDMFDGAGFLGGAVGKGQRLEGRRVALFGAGGAGSAIACALADAGVASIDIIDPEAGRADSLVAKLEAAFPQCVLRAARSRPPDATMIVNASPVGMQGGDGLPGDVGTLTPDMLVGDVVVKAVPTPLIDLATRHGCVCVTGHDMLGGQIDAIMNFFAPRATMPLRSGPR
ncbi:MAG: shikimate dehydrogenase [Casimicrobiaceae bacterium]